MVFFPEHITYGTVGCVNAEYHIETLDSGLLSEDTIDGDIQPTMHAETVVPKLRGLLHMINVPVCLIGGLVLLVLAERMPDRVGVSVWTLTALMLFGNSAVYHRGRWSDRVKAVLRRIDHSNIAIFIAGTYTPLAISLLGGGSRVALLSIIWVCALGEVLFRTLWMGAPRALYVGLYLVMGWASLLWLPQFWATGGAAIVIMIALGGVFYSVGAVIYARKAPNPSPTWFGFHELFHAGTVLGALCHWVAILLAVLG